MHVSDYSPIVPLSPEGVKRCCRSKRVLLRRVQLYFACLSRPPRQEQLLILLKLHWCHGQNEWEWLVGVVGVAGEAMVRSQNLGFADGSWNQKTP